MRLCGLAEYICFSQDVNIKVALSSLQFTSGANLTYLALPRTIFHGCQIVHWDPRNAKNFCPQGKTCLHY